jgi:hypothetical protein
MYSLRNADHKHWNLLSWLPYPLGGRKHFRNRIHVFRLHLSRRDSFVRQILELQQQVDQPEETSGVFSSIVSPGFRIRSMM